MVFDLRCKKPWIRLGNSFLKCHVVKGFHSGGVLVSDVCYIHSECFIGQTKKMIFGGKTKDEICGI